MFSLAVCQVNQWQHVASAAVVVAVAVLVGITIAPRGERLGTPASIILAILLSGMMPLALLMGFWPFNAHDPTCGYTPNPNEWVIFATVLAPLWCLLGLTGARLLRRS